MEGEDSTEGKITFLSNMFKQASSDDELRYLVRSFANKGLRIGLSIKSVENVILEKYLDDDLEQFEREVFGYRLRHLAAGPSKAMYHVPIKSMVGKPVTSADQVQGALNKKMDV